MKLYKTNRISLIELVEVIKYNDKSVWLMRGNTERREGRLTDYCSYFETFDEAKNHLITECESMIAKYKNYMEGAERQLEKIKSLTNQHTTNN